MPGRGSVLSFLLGGNIASLGSDLAKRRFFALLTSDFQRVPRV